MKNGIIINGVKYEAKAGRFANRSDSCRVCEFGKKCNSQWINGPCAPFDYEADESETVYFVKLKDQEK